MTSENRRSLDIAPASRGAARPTMYDERFVTPMRRELTEIGFVELRTAAEVDQAVPTTKGTSLVFVNSICGCSARMARPGVRRALTHSTRPEHLFTVFAGQDAEATDRARSYFTGYAPSSPSIALMRDGRLLWMLERRQIEGRPPEDVAADLIKAFDAHCGKPAGA